MAKKTSSLQGQDSGMFRGASKVEAEAPQFSSPSDDNTSEQWSAQDAIREIAKIAARFANGGYRGGHIMANGGSHHTCAACSGPRSLPSHLLVPAAVTATRENPVNAPAFWRKSAIERGFISKPQNIAALTSKYWGPKPRQITVSFMDSAASDLRAKIISHMNAWTKTGCISFVETSGVGQVRISRGQGGYWSYLGTDILHIPAHEQTMNLEGFTMATPESEYRRVVRHETGHTLGFPHEHMRQEIIARIDRTKIFEYALETYGWDEQTVDEQILTPIDEGSLLSGSTTADQFSIMCYQLPASVTTDGKPIVGGLDIDDSDYEFCGLIYPKPKAAAEHGIDRAHSYRSEIEQVPEPAFAV